MNQFSDLQSVYDYIEQYSIKERHARIADIFKQVRDVLFKQGKAEESQKAQVEVDVFCFQIYEGKTRPMFKATDENGKEIEYPSFERFRDNDYAYLNARFEETNAPLLKARYGHILWEGTHEVETANQTVEAYLQLSKEYEVLDKASPEKLWGVELLDAIENFFVLSLKLNYQTERAKKRILDIVQTYPAHYSSAFLIQFRLVERMLGAPRCFRDEDFKNVQEKLWEVALQTQHSSQFIKLCLTAEKVGRKIGNSFRNWQEEIGKKFEQMMSEEKGKDDVAAWENCQEAIQAYKKAGHHEKVSELEKVFAELKKNLELPTHKIDLDPSDYLKWCEETAEKVSELDFTQLINVLMWNKSLLPDLAHVREQAMRDKEQSLMVLTTPTILDSHGNLVQYFATEEEKQKFFEISQYGIVLSLKQLLIEAILKKSIEKGNLTLEALSEFLKKETWVGQSIPKGGTWSGKIEHTWLNLVLPSLKAFFEESQKPRETAQFILFIDSIVSKIEGMLRDICALIEIPTFKFERNQHGLQTTREKYMSELLYEGSSNEDKTNYEKLKQIIDENELCFLKFLFVEKSGMNLRNKVAHGLMIEKEYTASHAFLVLMALLRLSKYQFSDLPVQYDESTTSEADTST